MIPCTCIQCKKRFQPQRPEQRVCCEECLTIVYDGLVNKSRAIARKHALTLGYKSMSEVKFAVDLKQAGIKAVYEPDTFEYQYEPMKYTPDWRIKKHYGRTKVYLEYKGKLDRDTRKRLLTVVRCNPKLDLRLVFEKPNNKLFKGSKTTYWQWAEKNGFIWYAKNDVQRLARELRSKARPKKKDPA